MTATPGDVRGFCFQALNGRRRGGAGGVPGAPFGLAGLASSDTCRKNLPASSTCQCPALRTTEAPLGGESCGASAAHGRTSDRTIGIPPHPLSLSSPTRLPSPCHTTAAPIPSSNAKGGGPGLFQRGGPFAAANEASTALRHSSSRAEVNRNSLPRGWRPTWRRWRPQRRCPSL